LNIPWQTQSKTKLVRGYTDKQASEQMGATLERALEGIGKQKTPIGGDGVKDRAIACSLAASGEFGAC
jgi:hypothetical protein